MDGRREEDSNSRGVVDDNLIDRVIIDRNMVEFSRCSSDSKKLASMKFRIWLRLDGSPGGHSGTGR